MSAYNKIVLCLALSILLSPGFVCAAENVISLELRDGTKVSDVKYIKRKQSDSELSIEGITVGKSNLSDVQKKFQGNTIFHEGDAGTSLYVLCYEAPDGTILTFESGGEMGGPDHTITSIALYDSKSSYRLKEKCAKSNALREKLRFHDIYLGMTRSAAKKARGKPSKETPDYLIYEYHSMKKIKGQQADINSGVEIKFSNEKASQIGISKTESY